MDTNPLSIRYNFLLSTLAKIADDNPDKNIIGKVRVLAVSKAQSAGAIRDLYNCGQVDFGESYLQEALLKQNKLCDLAIVWHFIGQIQSRKAREIGKAFDWVHSINSLAVAQKVNIGAIENNKKINACIQINSSLEESKGGININDEKSIFSLVENIILLPNIVFRGLMSIPAPINNKNNEQSLPQKPFADLAQLLEKIKNHFPHIAHNLDTLSMGMSADFQIAVLEGASLIRIGTLLFGERIVVN